MPRPLVLQAVEDLSGATGIADGVAAALRRLYDRGATADELMDLAGSDGLTGMATLMHALQRLARSRLLGARLDGDEGPLLTVRRAPAAVAITPPAEPRRALSRLAYLRRDGERMVVESALSPVRIEIDDARVTSLLAAAPCALAGDDAAAVWDVLARCGLLAGAGESPSLAMWDFHEVLYHSRTRDGVSYGPGCATYRFRDTIDPLPEFKPPMSQEWIDLAIPGDDPRQPLNEVLANRVSVRTFASSPIACSELGEFLYRTARDVDGWRPYPAAGRCHELEIYANVAACDGLAPGLYHYAPREHRLYRCDTDPRLAARLVDHASNAIGGGASLQVVLIITARAGRVFWKYEGIGYSLILQDVGVVYQTMYLVATSMALGGCALGNVHGTLFAAASGLDFYEEGAVGGFIIGRPAP
jgi:SagB-type dehydrogenase family enzyme